MLKAIRKLRWCTLVFALASGCGLADYTERMDAQRKRVQEYDDANSLLDDPISAATIATKEGGKDSVPTHVAAWPFEFYLRLPRGFGTSPRESTLYQADFPCLRFAGGDAASSIFVAAAHTLDPNDAKAKDEFRKYLPKSFKYHLRKTAENYYAAISKSSVQLKERERPRAVMKVVAPYVDPNKPTVGYYRFQLTDEGNKQVKTPAVFDIYIFEEAGRQVGIMVHRPANLSNPEFVERGVEVCLGSLDVGMDAPTRRTKFKRAK